MARNAVCQVCSCGETHNDVQSSLKIGPGIIDNLGRFLKQLPLGASCIVLCDENTYTAAGQRVLQQLKQTGRSVQLLKFVRIDSLTADEYALGELMLALSTRPDFLIGVGSGTISDLVRYGAYIAQVPFVLVATAASMDGYSSVVAPLIQHGAKKTFTAKEPLVIYGDTDVLAKAPSEMIVAGIGDLLGKMVAKADWKLSHQLTGEPHCPVIQQQVDKALDLCIQELKKSSLTGQRFIQALMEGLVLSGQAITMFGSSRPASGSEHHLSHYWEMKALEHKRTIGLHGQKVGLGTRIMLQFYTETAWRVKQSSADDFKEVFSEIMADLPSVQEYDALLRRANISFSPDDLGISAEWIEDSLLRAMYARDRYTILRFASAQGWLEDITKKIMLDYK